MPSSRECGPSERVLPRQPDLGAGGTLDARRFTCEATGIIHQFIEKPLLEILTQVRNGLPATMFEQVASTLGLSTSTLAAKLGIARRTVTRKRGNGAPLSSETSEKLLRAARENLLRALAYGHFV
jgi:uncharacterized protein (DUF2384 family)